ncbi:MAG: hypothetical protein ABIW49_04595 [Knoellia sp.]
MNVTRNARTRAGTVGLVMGVVGALGLLGGAPAATADPLPPLPGLVITSVTVDRPSVAVASLNVVAVTLTVKATSELRDPRDSLGLTAELMKVGASTPTYLISGPLDLVSGTNADGTFRGTVLFRSVDNGNWKVTGVGPANTDFSPSGIGRTPVDGPTVTDVGSHIPRFSVTTSPHPVPRGSGYRLVGSVVHSSTGKPYTTAVDVGIGVGIDIPCNARSWPSRIRTTISGTFSYPLSAKSAVQLNCSGVLGSAASNYRTIVSTQFNVPIKGDIWAAPSATTAKVSTGVTVNGGARYQPGTPVDLQYLVGSTAWRDTGSRATVRTSGRITLIATPTHLGKTIYRAHVPTTVFNGSIDNWSRSFAVTGT